MKLLLLAGTLALCAFLADAISSGDFSTGQKSSACSSLKPGHGGIDFKTGNGGFTLEEEFLPGGKIKVTLSGPDFKGFIIQAVGADGAFLNTPFNDVGCTQGATIRHANSGLKNSVSAIWTPSAGGTPTFKATVVVNWTTFYKVA